MKELVSGLAGLIFSALLIKLFDRGNSLVGIKNYTDYFTKGYFQKNHCIIEISNCNCVLKRALLV